MSLTHLKNSAMLEVTHLLSANQSTLCVLRQYIKLCQKEFPEATVRYYQLKCCYFSLISIPLPRLSSAKYESGLSLCGKEKGIKLNERSNSLNYIKMKLFLNT